MRYEIIPVLTMLVCSIVIFWRHVIVKKRLDTARRFCDKAIDILDAYKEVEEMKNGNIEVVYEIWGKYFKIEYDPESPKDFMYQLEFAMADAFTEYEEIQDKEYGFTEEDWEYITDYFKALTDLQSHVRYESWQKGFRKI